MKGLYACCSFLLAHKEASWTHCALLHPPICCVSKLLQFILGNNKQMANFERRPASCSKGQVHTRSICAAWCEPKWRHRCSSPLLSSQCLSTSCMHALAVSGRERLGCLNPQRCRPDPCPAGAAGMGGASAQTGQLQAARPTAPSLCSTRAPPVSTWAIAAGDTVPSANKAQQSGALVLLA